LTTLPSASVNPTAPVNATPATSDARAAEARRVAIEIARLLSDDRCTDVTLLDVRGLTSVQDFVILASGTSDRQMRSAASDVKNLLPKLGSSVYRTSIDEQSTWIVVDCVDTVIHIFEPNTRSYYDLESMWGDAPKVEWLREGQKPHSPGDEAGGARESESGDTDEAAPETTPGEASEPDADLEMTTAPAAEMLDQVRAAVSGASQRKAAPKSPTKRPANAARSKKAPVKRAKAAAKPAKAAKASAKKALKKVAAGKKTAKAVAKKSARPAKKAAAKTGRKPAAGRPVKKKGR